MRTESDHDPNPTSERAHRPSSGSDGSGAPAAGAHAPSGDGRLGRTAGTPVPANPFDPLGLAESSLAVWRAAAADPAALFRTQLAFASAWTDVVANTMTALAGGKRSEPVIAPEPNDKRFSHPAWTENPLFDALKQGYLLATKATLDAIDAIEGLDPATRQRMRFFAKQYCDALSPTNLALLNPAVIEETLKTGGANLRQGLEHALTDLRENEGRVALVDRAAFEVGRNVAVSPGKVVFRNALIELLQYAPSTPHVHARPLLIVPPWINKFYVLDLQPTNSFIKHAVDQGFTTFVISWKNPREDQAELEMADYLRLGPLAALGVARAITGSPDVNLVGYCIGGTLTAMLLAYLARRGEAPLVRTATLFATLVDFREPGEIGAFLNEAGLACIEQQMAQRGYLEGRTMADTFNLLRANELIWSVAVNRYLLGKDAPAFDLLYWNSDATRMPRAMHRYYLRNMYLENNLVKSDALSVDGVGLDLGRITQELYAVATLEDHIAPWRSVYRLTQLVGGPVAFRLGHSGHIAGIISPPGKKKALWWSAPAAAEAEAGGGGAPARTVYPADPDAWFAAAEKHEGSWWPDWARWLAARSGEQVAAREPGTHPEYPALADAPGTYVRE